MRAGIPAICVGGSTLGGTGKTPLAIEIARHLSKTRKVALVGHGYRARPERARVVSPHDPLELVGDEALVCARAFEKTNTHVIVGPSRQSAMDLAARIADVMVIDGVLQLAPERARCSILTTPDGRAPAWLARHVDHVTKVELDLTIPTIPKDARVGLVTCLARPSRVVRALEAHGISISVHRAFRNHGPAERVDFHQADVWLATEKCALHVEGPVRVLQARARLELDHVIRAEYLDFAYLSQAHHAENAAHSSGRNRSLRGV